MSKFHMLYLTYMIVKDRVNNTKFVDPNVKALLELLMKVFVLN